MEWIIAIPINGTGESKVAEGRGESKILKLPSGTEIIFRNRKNIAQWKIRIALLSKGWPRVVAIALIRGCERNARIGQSTADVLEIVIGKSGLDAEVVIDSPIHTELSAD